MHISNWESDLVPCQKKEEVICILLLSGIHYKVSITSAAHWCFSNSPAGEQVFACRILFIHLGKKKAQIHIWYQNVPDIELITAAVLEEKHNLVLFVGMLICGGYLIMTGCRLLQHLNLRLHRGAITLPVDKDF